MSSNRTFRWITLALAFVVVGYAGLRFGRVLRERRSAPATEQSSPFPFRPGDRFPDVALADSLDQPVQLSALVADHGGVVLLLETDCDGCVDMAIRWEQALADGFFDPTRVFAVSRTPRATNEAFRAANHLSFPVYRDVGDAFVQTHRVLSYPLEVIVGQSGTIQSVSDDSHSPVDVEDVRRALAE